MTHPIELYEMYKGRPQREGITAGNRMSALPVAEYCGAAHTLPNASGRPAVMSSAFHALASRAPDADDKLARLTPEEREELSEWHLPADEPIGGGKVLRYAEAERELEVTLRFGSVVSVGHLDCAWVVDGVAYVVDLKRSLYTAEPDSLQLLAYGVAYALLRGARYFVTGIWGLTEGEYNWGEAFDRESAEGQALLRRLELAIGNRSEEFAQGSHCRNCWGRWQCPAYMLPRGVAESYELPSSKPTLGQALELKVMAERFKDTAKVLEEMARQVAAESGGLPDGKGKVWKPIPCKGRESLDKAKLFAELPEAKRFLVRGASYEQFRWVKAP